MQKTKEQYILNILRHRSLTAKEAYKYGDTCLNTTVSDLRKRGHNIIGEWESCINRFGKRVKVMRYHLADSPQEEIKKA